MGKIFGRIILFGLPVLILVGFVVVMGLMIATQPQPQRASPEPRPVAVFVEAVQHQDVALTIRSNGEARPRTQIDLVPQVPGRIVHVSDSFIEGGFFEAGETLVQLDDADYRLAVVRAEATVAQARQRLQREQAEADLARREWAEIGSGEASSLTLREPQMAEARAALAAADASLQEARLNLQRTRISAPFPGRVRTKTADLGQFVSPGARLGQVFSTDVVEVRLPLTDADLALIDIPIAFRAVDGVAGPRVTLSAVLAGQRREWAGRIVRTDSAIDPQTRVLYAIAQVDDPYGAAAGAGAPLPVGLFVDAEIEGRMVGGAMVMPRAALRGRDQVFVAERGGRLSVRQVNVVTSDAERLVVTSGVEEGDYVIVSPVRGASDGMRVQAVDASGQVIEGYSPPAAAPTASEPVSDASAAVASAG